MEKKEFTTSEIKGNREKYELALKLSLPLSWSNGGVTKGTN